MMEVLTQNRLIFFCNSHLFVIFYKFSTQNSSYSLVVHSLHNKNMPMSSDVNAELKQVFFG